ncbi:MAG: YitT family protein, partial [Bacteroidales bacterium]|nr:YitT family protein [Bacteroidales bacterium]
MEQKAKRVLNGIKEYTIITVGLLLYTVGWNLFLIPNGLVGGGVTGIASIIYYSTGFPVSYSFFIINGILLAIALKVLGKSFGIKTVFAIVAVTIFLDRIPGLLPQELIQDVAIGNGKLLSAIMGGVCSGAGIAI